MGYLGFRADSSISFFREPFRSYFLILGSYGKDHSKSTSVDYLLPPSSAQRLVSGSYNPKPKEASLILFANPYLPGTCELPLHL